MTPVVQAVSLEDGEEALMLTALEPVVLTNGKSGKNSKTIKGIVSSIRRKRRISCWPLTRA